MNEYVQRKIIGWTLLIVILLGVIEIKIFLLPPSTVLKAIAMSRHNRMPANDNKNVEANALLDVADEILKYKVLCKHGSPDVDAGSSKQLLIQFETCPNDDLEISTIVNATNSYQATVFKLDEDHQTSDFIPLKEGKNHLKIVLLNSASQKSEIEIVFNRALSKPSAH